MNTKDQEIVAYNAGLKQAQWQITKAMMGLTVDEFIDGFFGVNDIRKLLKFIHDEIEGERK